jgi:hypothetical protein
LDDGEFNLDFKAIPHWGDESILERNWSATRRKAIKSILALIVQNPDTGYLSYTDAEIKHRNQNESVLEFVDFWKEGHQVCPNMLIFDSKFTTYKNLSKLNQDNIKFLTLRRRGNRILNAVEKTPESQWQKVKIEGKNRKYQLLRVHDGTCNLRNYEGEVRQIILTEHGREQPSFMISNDFDMDIRGLVKKYARRWLVEKEIAEQIAHFHLNNPSSSIVVKVDFDLTLSLLAYNLYRVLANELCGFEKCTIPTIYQKFVENGAVVKIANGLIEVSLKKKTHLPILLELPWLKKVTYISWLGASIKFNSWTAS